MATTKLYLDTRAAKPGSPAPLKVAVTHKGATALITLDIRLLPSQWDKVTGRVTAHPAKAKLNNYIAARKLDIDNALLDIMRDGGGRGLSVTALRDRIARATTGDDEDGGERFAARFIKFANSKTGGTRQVYMHTLRRLQAYAGGSLDGLRFEDIDRAWLTGFDAFLARTSPSRNARNIHLRNIRAVFNDAIDDEVTTAYPFRKFKIRPEPTRKRSLSVGQLRELLGWPVEAHAVKYLDMFKLTFFLIGINLVDLCRLRVSDLVDGRIEYRRAKTHRLYSVKVEPEAMEIIERYRGTGHLLDILDRYANHKDYMKKLNTALQRIGRVTTGRHGAKSVEPLFPQLTTYWARHSWATIAASLDIPKETIAAALGHGGNTVTDIYIDFDRRKVDEANRRVLDWVLYGRRRD